MTGRYAALAIEVLLLAACGADSQDVTRQSDPPAPTRISLAFRPPEGARWTFERSGTTRVDGRTVRGVQRGEVASAEPSPALSVRLIHVSSTESGTTTTVVPDRTGGEVSFVQRYDARGRMVEPPDVRREPGTPMSAALEGAAPALANRRVGSAGFAFPEGSFAFGEELTTSFGLPTGGVVLEVQPVAPCRCRASPGEHPGLVDFECDATIDRRTGEGALSTTIAGTVHIEATIDRASGVAMRTRERWDGRVSITIDGRVSEHHKITDVTTVLEPIAAR